MGDRRFNVPIVGGIVLALDGEDRNAVVLHERRRDVVLRAERVGGAEAHVRSAGFQGDGKIGGFRRHMQAGCDPHAFERLLPLESLPDEP